MRPSRDMAGGDSALDSPQELDSLSDSGSDYEAELKTTKRKKAAGRLQPPKRTWLQADLMEVSSPTDSPITTRDSPQQQPSQGMSRQTFPRRVIRAKEGYQGISAEHIYNAVFSGKSAMVTVVDEWLDNYKQSRETGLLALINFIVQSCGCKGAVTREMLSSMENAEIISTLTKEFSEESVNYPLSTPGPQLKRFKAGLCEFAKVLVGSCRNSLIYDAFLFPSLLALLTGMSDSQVRAFRHTSTLLAMKLMTGLVEVAALLSVQLQTIKRRYDIENNKTALDRPSARLEELQATLSQAQENREELHSLMNAMFRGVFVHRYRDRLSDIRAVCIEELGIWLKTDPEDFLTNGYLKYLGWTLHDKQRQVRLQCVRALQGLYQEKEFIGRLELFTSRFKERILSMALDKEPDVALEVVNLLLLIHQGTDEGLNEDECSHIYPLVFVSHRGLACAAGNFLYHRVKRMSAGQNQQSYENDNAAFIQMLLAFYIQCEFHEYGKYLVDSLWDVAGSELRDWETMSAYLLRETGLSDKEEGSLIELMVCAIQRASQASPPVGRAQGKKMLSMKEKKIQKQDRGRITAHFIPLLPQLLRKYSADASKVTLLLSVPLSFDLELYSGAQQMDKHLDLFLSQICGIVEKHTNAAVLEACARLASCLCSDCYTFSSRAHTAFSQLLDRLTEYFNSYLNDLLQGTADDDEVYSATMALKRIGTLGRAKDLTAWKLFGVCLQLLSSRLESTDLEVELKVAALKCAASQLMWAKVNAVNATPTEAEIKILKREVHSFCKACQACLSETRAEIRDEAFELLCDVLMLYNLTSVRSEPALQTLAYLPSDSLRSELAAFLLDYVFNDAEDEELTEETEKEKRIRLQKKRNHLGGYCKLVIYGVLDLSAATDVFKHYSKYFKDFGDIVKELLSKTKLINPVLSARTLCLSLQQLFAEMLTEERDRQDFGEIRELAKRLAMSFGVDLHRARTPLVALHMDGIHFAFRPPQEGEQEFQNVPFLETLSEFSFKLLLKDRAQLSAFLKLKCPKEVISWSSVRLYQRSLEACSFPKPRARGKEGVDQHEAVSSQHSPVPKRKRTTASGRTSSTVSTDLNESGSDSSSIHSTPPTPALTSTVLKEPSKGLASRIIRATESDIGSGLTDSESEDEFSSVSRMRKALAQKRRHSFSSRQDSALEQTKLSPCLTLLSLIEDNEEAHIEDYESKSSSTQFSNPHSTPTVLDELFWKMVC